MTSPWHCHLVFSGMLTVVSAACCSQSVPPGTPLPSTPCSGHAWFRAFVPSCPLGRSVTPSCSLQARFAISIHLLSPHILSQLPDVLIKTDVFSFSLHMGGRRKPPSGCLPGAVTSAFCCIKASAHVEWGLVTDVRLSVHLNVLGAVTLPAWTSSGARDKHSINVMAQARVTGDMSCCWDTCCFASGASQLCNVTVSNPNVVMYQWEDVNMVRMGHCTPN